MTTNNYLYFISDIIREKHVYQDKPNRCPFCNREELEEILDEKGSILLVKNKFQTLENTYQMVIIETDECQSNISMYSIEHLHALLAFGIDHWLAFENSGDYQSVILYKNHGTLSGGTISHPHMQIVGLKDIDYRSNLNDDMFEGIEIHREGEHVLNVSTKPNACATEFNIIVNGRDDLFMAKHIQKIVTHLLSQWHSFNLFFYQWKGAIICKLAPRYVTSPFLIGYSIPQTSNHIEKVATEVKNKYYSEA